MIPFVIDNERHKLADLLSGLLAATLATQLRSHGC
jgi:hypothetical protein